MKMGMPPSGIFYGEMSIKLWGPLLSGPGFSSKMLSFSESFVKGIPSGKLT